VFFSFQLAAQTEDLPSETDSSVFLGSPDRFPSIGDCSSDSLKEAQSCFQKHVLRHVKENFNFSEVARKRNIHGKIYVNFVIEKDASLSNVKVVYSTLGWFKFSKKSRKAKAEMRAEAVRVVKLLEFNSPAYINGKPVRSRFTLPINLKLE
tara:strand:- start:1057 stop:1509 length:453 start_codon:yes stop_codon:yes gene_type:complete